MFFRLSAQGALTLALGVGACGGHTSELEGAAGANGMGVGSGGTPGAIPPSGGTGGTLVKPKPPDVSGYEEPVCPPQPKPAREFLCDPLAIDAGGISGCGSGQACYPFLAYASDASGCGQEFVGAECRDAGAIPRGAECGQAIGRCAPGHMCVIGGRPGKRCVPMCSLDGPSSCTGGLLCVETDIEGIGVCG